MIEERIKIELLNILNNLPIMQNQCISSLSQLACKESCSIYTVKKYMKRKSNEAKPTFGPCFLICKSTSALLIETKDNKPDRLIDMSFKVDPHKQKKFENAIFSYKIIKEL